ncbi:MAG: hypothetical protein HY303_19225 [Candidatus Wallbacteria bacterium]|nr:hypothetical protein [Candidatus Wallbacteria bacterium]
MIPIPSEIVWDYPEPPQSEAWRLQRIAEFFPHCGRDRVTVAALYQALHRLRIAPEVADLISLYAELLEVTGRSRGK